MLYTLIIIVVAQWLGAVLLLNLNPRDGDRF
jgi:hypothetical protein